MRQQVRQLAQGKCFLVRLSQVSALEAIRVAL